jgi:LytS/YehU family sensor histidine kinase
LPHILNKLIANYGIPIFAAAIVIFKKWYIYEQNNKRLAQEKMSAELNFLKAQIHPHFLFNTLNNLYALTLTKSKKTPDIVLKLADLLDYMIYKSNDKFVPLTKELEIVEGYIELEKMRYNERLDLKYELIGDPDSHEIAPLILLPFIENCFKHGASKDRIKPSINIQIDIEPSCLTLKAINSIPKEKHQNDSENSGIGLSNVKRRLGLIYPGQHELEINSDEKNFEIKLKLFWKK